MTNFADRPEPFKYDPTDFEYDATSSESQYLIDLLSDDIRLLGYANRFKDYTAIPDTPMRVSISYNINLEQVLTIYFANKNLNISVYVSTIKLIKRLIELSCMIYNKVTSDSRFTDEEKESHINMLDENGVKGRIDEYIKITRKLNSENIRLSNKHIPQISIGGKETSPCPQELAFDPRYSGLPDEDPTYLIKCLCEDIADMGKFQNDPDAINRIEVIINEYPTYIIKSALNNGKKITTEWRTIPNVIHYLIEEWRQLFNKFQQIKSDMEKVDFWLQTRVDVYAHLSGDDCFDIKLNKNNER